MSEVSRDTGETSEDNQACPPSLSKNGTMPQTTNSDLLELFE